MISSSPTHWRKTAGFLLDFQPGVDAVLAGFWEMPHLVDVLDLVAQLDGFLQFGGAHTYRSGRARVRSVRTGRISARQVFAFLLARTWHREER